MNDIIDFLEELRTRLESQLLEDKRLYGIKRIVFGHSIAIEGEARRLNEYPIINIFLNQIESNNKSFPNICTSKVNLEVQLFTNKVDNYSNNYYDKDNEIGSIYLYNNLLNSIELNSDDQIDLKFNDTVQNFFRKSTKIVHFQNLILYTIFLEVETKHYTAGKR